MRILKVVLLVLFSIAALVVILGIFAKKNYHIERSIDIRAPKEMVFEYVRYFKNYREWNPWTTYDPQYKESIEGTDGQVGAVYHWDGNKKIGKGSQEIVFISPDTIKLLVHLMDPMSGGTPAKIFFDTHGDTTHVSWAMDVHVDFPWNGLAMFTDMNTAIGKDYIRGLENLKKIIEDVAHPKYAGYEVDILDMPEIAYAGLRDTMAIDSMAAAYPLNLQTLFAALAADSISPTGPMAGIYWSWDQDSLHLTDMAVAIPVQLGKDQKLKAPVSLFGFQAGKAAVINFYGNYDSLGLAHAAMDTFFMKTGRIRSAPIFEEYITDPAAEPDTSKWLTRLIYPVKE